MADSQGLIGKIFQETYRIERQIGEGGMGQVYQARHVRLEKNFAIKVLTQAAAKKEGTLKRFKSEALVTSAIGHPHILEVIDFNETTEGNPYIVMEYLEGEDLATRIARQKRLTLEETASIFRQTASALTATHKKGIVHRDLKPHNIFLCRRGERNDYVKVVDFGISKILGTDSELTKTHALLGTPYYIAPEQAEDSGVPVDSRADIYAMGAIVFEMLTGAHVYEAQTVLSLLLKIVTQNPPMLSSLNEELPQALDGVIDKALKKDPNQRYATIDEFWNEFDEVLHEIGTSFHEPTEDRTTDGRGPSRTDNPPVANPPENEESELASLRTVILPHVSKHAVLDQTERYDSSKKRWIWFGTGALVIVLSLAMWWITSSQRVEKKGTEHKRSRSVDSGISIPDSRSSRDASPDLRAQTVADMSSSNDAANHDVSNDSESVSVDASTSSTSLPNRATTLRSSKMKKTVQKKMPPLQTKKEPKRKMSNDQMPF